MRLVGGGITLRSVSLGKEEVNRAESTAQAQQKEAIGKPGAGPSPDTRPPDTLILNS